MYTGNDRTLERLDTDKDLAAFTISGDESEQKKIPNGI